MIVWFYNRGVLAQGRGNGSARERLPDLKGAQQQVRALIEESLLKEGQLAKRL
jgi:hypothetical protein